MLKNIIISKTGGVDRHTYRARTETCCLNESRDPKPRRDRQHWTKKKNVRSRAKNRKNGVTISGRMVLTNLHHFLTTCIWDALKENASNGAVFEQYTKMFESRIYAGATENYRDGRNVTRIQCRGPAMWKHMLKHLLNDTVIWQDLTGSLLIGCLKQRSKSNMLTPETNWLTF